MFWGSAWKAGWRGTKVVLLYCLNCSEIKIEFERGIPDNRAMLIPNVSAGLRHAALGPRDHQRREISPDMEIHG
jgi:hypothetical protein